MGCTFCATGQMGLRNNLTAGEIVWARREAARLPSSTPRRLGNVVFMRMGEPMNGYLLLPVTSSSSGGVAYLQRRERT